MDEGGPWDLASMREEEFEHRAVYLVPDASPEPGCANRAEQSLPRNLVLKPSEALSDVSTEQVRMHNVLLVCLFWAIFNNSFNLSQRKSVCMQLSKFSTLYKRLHNAMIERHLSISKILV